MLIPESLFGWSAGSVGGSRFRLFLSLLLLPLIFLPDPCLARAQRPDASEEPIRIALESRGQGSYFRVVGLDDWRLDSLSAADLTRLLAVYVAEPSRDLPPLLGSLSVEQGTLIFEPRFPLQPGLRYRAVLDASSVSPDILPTGLQSRRIAVDFDIPDRIASDPTKVKAVYPSTALVPENLLKFYVHFSAPMSRGEVYRFVRLFDESNQVVELPFLEIEQELWDSRQRRLTLFIDPGRIKRGLLPQEQVGTALVAGKQYRMVILQEWPDARGKQLQESFTKAFRVGPPDRTPLDPQKWSLKQPKAGTLQPLCVEFSEPLDHALLQRLLEVVGRERTPVAGAPEVSSEERVWCFKPEEPWSSGEFYLSISTALEDLAGNRIGRPFEVDVFEQVEERIVDKRVWLPFQVPKD